VFYVVHQKGDKHKWTALPRDLTPMQDSRFATIMMQEGEFISDAVE
jgi:hypothetical protein